MTPFSNLGTRREWTADLLGGIGLIAFFIAVFFVLGVSFDTPERSRIVHHHPAETTNPTEK